MKIAVFEKQELINPASLKAGETFRQGDYYYIRTDEKSAVDLRNGTLYPLCDFEDEDAFQVNLKVVEDV